MTRDEEMSERLQRKLTTILAADVVGYSRMMSADENGTHELLGRCRKIIALSVEHHDGRVFNTAGDSVMAEFGSTVEAVRCAIEIQEEIAARNTDKPAAEQMWFRVGLNVGDVIVEGDDLIGDGVNIASRMESIAAPGGICISGSVYELVRNKLSFAFEDMGRQSVKNIVEPVPAFSLLPAATPQITPGAAGAALPRAEGKKRSRASMAAAAACVLGAAIAAAYFAGRDPGPPPAAVQEPGSALEPAVTGTAGTDRKPDDAPSGSGGPTPAYFAGRTIEGVTRGSGERFVVEMTERGSAVVSIYGAGKPTEPPRRDSGRWWINRNERICFEFRKFGGGKAFCRIHAMEEGREWLVSGDPARPKWELKAR